MIRWANASDSDLLGQIMFDAIHGGDSPYTAAQRRAWLPAPNAGPVWAGRLARQRVAVAEVAGTPVGFMSLTPNGTLDLAFLLPAHRGHGLFAALFRQIEQEALARGLDSLTTHASMMAQGPFAAAGFTTEQAEHLDRNGEVLTRFLMRKWLV